MKKKGSKKHAPWEDDVGWRPVEVGDELLLGSDEFGFAGLEELDPSMMGEILGAAAAAPAEEQGGAGGKETRGKQAKKKRKQPKGAGSGEAAEVDVAGEEAGQPEEGGSGEGNEESVEALRAKIARLESENQELKGNKAEQRQKKRAARLERLAATKEARAAKRAAAKAARAEARAQKAAAAAAEAAQEGEAKQPLADVSAWGPFELHRLVERAVAQLGFSEPTRVQSECIPAAVRDRRDVIGAAQTGSGKTLAFGLPIMQLLLQEREREQQRRQLEEEENGEAGGEAEQAAEEAVAQPAKAGEQEGKLRALILAPTRELAMQVCEHLQRVGRVCGIWVVPIVGGISAQKQERLLSKRPEVVVATPGRLWDLMKVGQAHVSDLSRLSFLVIDEADRMVQQGHYQELTDILAAIPKPSTQQEAAEDAAAAAAARTAGGEGAGEEQQEEEEEGPAQQAQQRQQYRRRRHFLQTFVFSATLTLPATLRKRLRKGGGGAVGSASLDSLMDRVPFRAKPKIVDLTSQRKLADKVEEAYIECGEAERDEYLYTLLSRHPGRTLVFVNAISSVRRLGAILKMLGLPVHPLHAGMQQRARLKALDRFKTDPNAILVATDVAARGLDVKDVRCVIHYQIPASVDVYVHRSGRTARAEAEGVSIALVTPKESARFAALLRALGRDLPPEFPVDLSLMPAAHKRVRLAVRLDDISRRQSKQRADASWRRQNAEALGIVLSDEEEGGSDEEGAAMEGKRVGKRARRDKGGARGPDEDATAEELRAELAGLLAEPLQPSFSRKFFTGGAAAAVAAHLGGGSSGGAAAAPAKRGKAAGKRAATQAEAEAGGEEGTDDGSGSGSGGEEASGEDGEGREPAGLAPAGAAATVSEAVQLAQRMAASRAKAAADVRAKAAKQQKNKNKGKKAPADPRAAALRAALAKHGAKKAAGKRRGLFVIPQAFGRDVQGPDALQALRSKLAAL